MFSATRMIFRTAIGLSLLLAIAGPATAGLPKIGVPAAVRPAAHGTPPGAEARILQVGLDLQANEQIETGATGQTHLLFVDGSTISIGPNASLRLDKFVYDSEAKEGELVVNVSKGLFRFVGGRISKKNAVLFKAPTAVIGIRGGVAIVQVNTPQQIAAAQNNGQTLPPAAATMLYGDRVTMQVGNQTQSITRPGFMISQNSGGVSSPQKATQAQLNQALAALEEPQTPPPGDDGEQTPEQLAAIAPAGGGPAVGDDDVANSQMASLGSDNNPNSVTSAGPGGAPLGAIAGLETEGEGILKDASQTPIEPLPICAEIGQTNCIPPSELGLPPLLEPTVVLEPVITEPPVIVEPQVPIEVAVPLTLPGNWAGRLYLTVFNETADIGYEADFPVEGGIVLDGFFTARVGDDLDIGVVEAGTFPISQILDAPVTGFGTLLPSQDFLIYEFTLLEDDDIRVMAWAGLPTPAPALGTATTMHYALRPDFVLGSSVPFVRGISGGSGVPPGEGGAFIDWSAGDLPPFAGWRIAVEGSGPGQTSAAGVFVGYVLDRDNPSSAELFAEMRGTSQAPGTETVFGFSSTAETERSSVEDGSNAFFGTAAPNAFTLIAGSGGANEHFQTDPSNAAMFRPAVIATATSGTTGSRTLTQLRGYAAGVAQYVLFDGELATGSDRPFVFENDGACCNETPNPNGIFPSDVFLTFDASERSFSAEFHLLDLFDDRGNDVAVYFGCTNSPCTAGAESVYLDDDTFAAIENPDLISSYNTGGFLTNQVDGDAKFYLVTSNYFDSNNFLPDGTELCVCEYVKWGFWGGTHFDGSAGDENARIHLATWVAGGDICNGCTLPTGIRATYQGHLIGSVINAGQLYLAAGSYEQVVDFNGPGSYSYSITVPDFDGETYTRTGVAGSQGTFGVAISGGGEDRTLAINGAFYGGGGDTAAEVAGGFRVTGTDYQAAGIVAATKTASVPLPGGE